MFAQFLYVAPLLDHFPPPVKRMKKVHRQYRKSDSSSVMPVRIAHTASCRITANGLTAFLRKPYYIKSHYA